MYIKKLSIAFLTLSIFGFCSSAFADDYAVSDSNFSLGVQAGYGKPDYGNQNNVPNSNFLPITSNETGGGISGRIYAAYQFNPYAGLEAGYSIFLIILLMIERIQQEIISM
jgi:hypothetical protein